MIRCQILESIYVSPYTDSFLQAICVAAYLDFLHTGELTISQHLGDLTFMDNHVTM